MSLTSPTRTALNAGGPGLHHYPVTLRDDLRAHVTAKSSRALARYNWFVYPHSFSRELVDIVLTRFPIGRQADSIIYDPFVGAGTTLLACQEMGISAYGLDQLPLSQTLTMAKVAAYNTPSLIRTWRQLNQALLQATSWPVPSSDIPLIQNAFHPDMLSRLMLLNKLITERVSDITEQFFFRTALLSILEDSSRARKAGGWIRLLPSAPSASTLLPRFNQQVKQMLRDLCQESVARPIGGWHVDVGDARTHIVAPKITGVISSPPYLNRHDYTRIFCLELALSFVSGQQQLKDLRYQSLRSHVEARRIEGLATYAMPNSLRAVLNELAVRGLNDGRLLQTIEGYFEDMCATLHCIQASLQPGGFVALVLGNSRFSGVTIPVDDIVAEIGETVGLRWRETWVARQRGNSAQQMANFGRVPSRESVIIWTNDE